MYEKVGGQGVVIVGAGPAGLAPLFAAASVGRLEEVLRLGVTILEQGKNLGAGSLGQHAVASDSTAEAFLDLVTRTEEPRLRALCHHPAAQELLRLGRAAAPLTTVAAFLEAAGRTLCEIVADSDGGVVLTGARVTSVRQTRDGRWRTRFVRSDSGSEHEIASSYVVLATGAHQPQRRLELEQVAGQLLCPRFQDKLLQSGEVLARGGIERVRERLGAKKAPRVAVIGGSTSAGAVALRLLNEVTGLQFKAGAVTLLHRQPLRIFYESEAVAVAEGYTEFRPQDVCSLTGRVFRFSGFRLDSRELIMRARQIGGRPEEPRLRLLQLLPENFGKAQTALEEADLIITALGYRPRLARVFDERGCPVPLVSPQGKEWSVVDERCRVLTAAGTPLKNLFAIGLSVGPKPGRELGGETDFHGQINSLWLWQHTLGLRIVEEITSHAVRPDLEMRKVTLPVHPPAAANVNFSGRPELVRPRPRTGNENIPLMRPDPPRLSEHVAELARIEELGVYSNYGPLNTRFEQELCAKIFGEGGCLAVCNATTGLMMAIREVLDEDRPPTRRYALMPSFTFAATAHAALWCGLTPLLCDIDPETWLPDPASEEALLQRYKGQIAVVIPYATFGNNLDLRRYQDLSERYDVPVVVDAAGSLGSLDERGRGFGTGFAWPIVFSLHATKAFSVGEGGVIYSADSERIRRLRSMGCFGFEESRSAGMLGLNAKLTEVSALTALLQLDRFAEVVENREELSACYRDALRGEYTQQRTTGLRQVCSFESVLLPKHLAPLRKEILKRLSGAGIGAGHYFSPHLAEQPYFRKHAVCGPLPVTEEVASRIVSLPLLPSMSVSQVHRVVTALRAAVSQVSERVDTRALHPEPRSVGRPLTEPIDIPLRIPPEGLPASSLDRLRA